MNQPIKDYINNKNIVSNLTYRYNGATGEKGYLWAGVLISEETIKEMFPVGEKIILFHHNHKGDNPDKTRII